MQSGTARLLEYAFGSEPWIADRASQALTGEVVARRLRVSFPRRMAGTSELTYTRQASRDFIDWGALRLSFLSATTLPDKPGFEQATFQCDALLSEESAQFVRLKLVLP